MKRYKEPKGNYSNVHESLNENAIACITNDGSIHTTFSPCLLLSSSQPCRYDTPSFTEWLKSSQRTNLPLAALSTNMIPKIHGHSLLTCVLREGGLSGGFTSPSKLHCSLDPRMGATCVASSRSGDQGQWRKNPHWFYNRVTHYINCVPFIVIHRTNEFLTGNGRHTWRKPLEFGGG